MDLFDLILPFDHKQLTKNSATSCNNGVPFHLAARPIVALPDILFLASARHIGMINSRMTRIRSLGINVAIAVSSDQTGNLIQAARIDNMPYS